MNLYEVAEEIGRRLASIFLKDKYGRRHRHVTIWIPKLRAPGLP
jgi:hypothetical protein